MILHKKITGAVESIAIVPLATTTIVRSDSIVAISINIAAVRFDRAFIDILREIKIFKHFINLHSWYAYNESRKGRLWLFQIKKKMIQKMNQHINLCSWHHFPHIHHYRYSCKNLFYLCSWHLDCSHGFHFYIHRHLKYNKRQSYFLIQFKMVNMVFNCCKNCC